MYSALCTILLWLWMMILWPFRPLGGMIHIIKKYFSITSDKLMALSTAWPTLPPPLKLVESILNKALDSHVVKKMTFNLV